MNEWISLLKDLGIFSIGSGLLTFLLNRSANRKLEEFKHELSFSAREHGAALNTDLEKYKSEISLHLNRQSKLHDKRIQVIDEIYPLLVKLESSMSSMAAPIKIIINDGKKEDSDRIQAAQEAFVDYNNYFLLHRLYLEPKICDLLEKVRTEYQSANYDYFWPQRMDEMTRGQTTPETKRKTFDMMIAASEKITKEIPQMLRILEDEFRRLLGVSN